MSLKASKIPILWYVAMLVCMPILGYIYLQPAAARAIERNSLMLTWIHSVPLSEMPDLLWSDKLTDSSRSSFLMLANRFDALCKAASSDRDATCLRADMAHLIATAGRNNPLAQLDRYNPNSTEQIVLAALAGDMAYSRGDSEAAVEIWRQYLPPKMLIYRVQVAVEREDYRVASILLASLDQGYVPESESERAYMASILVKLARFNVDSGEFADAEFYWRWAIRQLPEQAAYYNGLANALARQERWAEAIAAYQDAIQLDPKAHYYVRLAQAFVRVGETEQAIAAARRALELDPDNAAAQRLLQRLGQE